MQTRASSSQGQNDPLSPSPAQGTQIPALPAPPAPTHCLRQAPGSQGLAEPHPTQLRIFIVLSLPSPVQAPQGSAPWLFISLGSLLQIQIKAMKKLGTHLCKNRNCAALILKLSCTVLWLGVRGAGRNEFLTHFSLDIFGLQCLRLPTAHPRGPITVQPPTRPPLPLPTPRPLPLRTPLPLLPPIPPPQHQPTPPRQPQAIILHPTAGALRSLPAVPHG